MIENYRSFQAGPDPFDKVWRVDFAWLQTGIAIRHADTVDAKFFLESGSERLEKVVALPHPDLLELSAREDRPLTDPWCLKLAAHHIEHMVETGDDMEKTLVTVSAGQLRRYAALLDETVAAGS